MNAITNKTLSNAPPGDERLDGGRSSMPLWHVALSVSDVRRTYRWYHEILGMVFARSTSLLAGPMFSWILGVRGAASSCWWLNDRQDLFQLELFEFRRPPVRALPASWRPCDIGYTGLSFHVEDFDSTLERAARCGSMPVGSIPGEPGARRACVTDPDGVLIEIMEEDPRDDARRDRPRARVPAVARSVTLSVGDLARSRDFFVDGLGLREATDVELHHPEHEAMWGLPGAVRDSVLLWADDFLLEIVSYREPRPAPRESGYRISDTGIFHICFGSLDRSQFRRVRDQCRAAGGRGNSPTISFGVTAGLYVVDEQGFTVELLHRHPLLRQSADATPRAVPQHAEHADGDAQRRRQMRFDGAIVIAADTDIGVELCRLLAEDQTSLWLLDDDSVGSAGTTAASTLVLDLSQTAVCSPREPSNPRPFELLASVLSTRASTDDYHVTVVADARARRELAALREHLVTGSYEYTLAMLARHEQGSSVAARLELALSLTAREAAEAIYRATLRRKRSVWPGPSPWPPRHAAVGASTLEHVTLLPVLAGSRRPLATLSKAVHR